MTNLPTTTPRVAVIGAGVAGLSCAALLAKSGLRVTVFEKNRRVGGKLWALEREGFHWDMGPSLLTMPHVFEDFWRRLGRRLDEDLTLVPLPVTCRYHWSDRTVIDEDYRFWQRPDVARFLEYTRGLYDLSAEAFLYHPLDEWRTQLTPGNLRNLRHFPKIASPRTMDATVRRFFGHDPHLVQLFDRFATYNGSSPYQTPSAFNIIAFVEGEFSGWYVKGGLHSIGVRLREIAANLGVEFRLDSEVTALEGTWRERPEGTFSVHASSGEGGEHAAQEFDYVVCNQDVLSAYPRFLAGKTPGGNGQDLAADFQRKKLDRLDPSMSGFILHLGVGREFPQLSQHNIFFSDDYRREFTQIFDERQPADEPTIYVAIHSKADPERAPAGCENWFVLVNAPALAPAGSAGRVDWDAIAADYGNRILERLETRFGLAGLRESIRVRGRFTPADFETRYLARAGSLYGFASHGVWSAFQRPALTVPGVPRFFFTGGSTHPGGGLPLVCLSGQAVADKILRAAAAA